jgi:hypothetical protein
MQEINDFSQEHPRNWQKPKLYTVIPQLTSDPANEFFG